MGGQNTGMLSAGNAIRPTGLPPSGSPGIEKPGIRPYGIPPLPGQEQGKVLPPPGRQFQHIPGRAPGFDPTAPRKPDEPMSGPSGPIRAADGMGSLAGMFMANNGPIPSSGMPPMAQMPQMSGLPSVPPPISQPLRNPLPPIPSQPLPPPAAPAPVNSAPAGFQSAAGQSVFGLGRGRNADRGDQLWGSGVNHGERQMMMPAIRAAHDNGGRLPEGAFQSVFNPAQYLVPGMPGHPGFVPGGGAAGGARPMGQPSQAQLLAAAINQRALNGR